MLFRSTAPPPCGVPKGAAELTYLLPLTRTSVLPEPKPKLFAIACPTLSVLWLPKPFDPVPAVNELDTPTPGNQTMRQQRLCNPYFHTPHRK